MALKPEHIGRDRRICNLDGKKIKKATNHWRRQKWRQDVEAPIEKQYHGYVA